MKHLILLFTVVALCSCSTEKHPLVLSPIISDHMVVQQKQPIVIWGLTVKGAKVTARGSWGATSEVCATDSTWTLEMGPPAVGGPYELTISTKDTTTTINDLYSGEVWLASGQSNMEWPLSATNDAESEIVSADFPLIRMFSVPKFMSFTETKDLAGYWERCSPETAGEFSAVAYFFAKNLNQLLNVPIGIIESSWGGTPAESWTSTSTLRELTDFDKQLDKAAKENMGYAGWLALLEKVSISGREIDNIDMKDEELADPAYDDSAWKVMDVPSLWETKIGNFDGVMWFRKKIDLAESPEGACTLSLGPVDDMDITYVNGTEVGKTVGSSLWQADRAYTVPEGILTAGENVIAVKVFDNMGGGGIYGSPELLTLTSNNTSIPLSGEWKYLPVAEYLNSELYYLGFDNVKYSQRPASMGLMMANTPSILYNGMIAPVIDYNFKGAIWYQGEANVGRAQQYMKLFPAMIKDWREKAGYQFPFYYVQIAPYQYSKDGTASADLRESQRRTMDVLDQTGMVVTLDIGNVNDIHPRNKKDVGFRLAKWALSHDYGQEMVFSGPIYESHKTEGNTLRVSFKYAASGLGFGDEKSLGFEIAGEDGVFYPAKVTMDGSDLILSSPQVSKPVNARYAWSDISEATLFNQEGFPASTFNTKW